MLCPGRRLATGLVAALLPAASAASEVDLTRLSLDELANLKVVSVSRSPEARLGAAGAVHVTTGEDIHRSGALSLPDAIRLAPGVQASRIDADEWALAVRGFASRLSRFVLVLVDGRSVWTPVFAGVFWNAQDTVLGDLDRIEVSRGPGGPLFGANAVNGVINIVSKGARETQGGYARAVYGPEQRLLTLRWGGARGDALHYRVFGKYHFEDGTEPVGPTVYDDDWELAFAGFRVDGRRGTHGTWTAQGQVYDGGYGQRSNLVSFTPPFTRVAEKVSDLGGGHLLAGWTHAPGGDRHETAVRAWYDRTTRHEVLYRDVRDTFDLDLQHRIVWGRHGTTFGLTGRTSRGRFEGMPTVRLEPSARTDDIAGVFGHHEARLAGDRLRLSGGAKLEWNDYSGWNAQPSARLAFRPTPRHTLWAAATRAVRTSSRVERDIVFYSSLSPTQPLFTRLEGWPDFRPESVVALEAGYKASLSRVYVDLTAFRSRYQDLSTNEVMGAPRPEPAGPGEPARLVVPIRIGNGQDATAWGAEASLTTNLGQALRLQASYSFIEVDQRPKPGSTDASTGFERNTPRHQVWVTSFWNVRPGVEVDLVFRRVGAVPGHAVEAFSQLDGRLAWQPRSPLELVVAGQNLLRPRQVEFGGGFAAKRSLRAEAVVRF